MYCAGQFFILSSIVFYVFFFVFVYMFMFFFFFSSRRRHTRLQGDWSSDVCSSDLERLPPRARRRVAANARISGRALARRVSPVSRESPPPSTSGTCTSACRAACTSTTPSRAAPARGRETRRRNRLRRRPRNPDRRGQTSRSC